jgi:hypothetical protein
VIGEHTYRPGRICETLITDYSAAVQARMLAASSQARLHRPCAIAAISARG